MIVLLLIIIALLGMILAVLSNIYHRLGRLINILQERS